MAAEEISKDAMACNCCNGRVGRELLELAEQKREFKQFVVPTGVELVKAAAEIGLATAQACNCCNGRVGKKAIDDLITTLGGG